MDIGLKLKRLRTENNLTQEELADRCELSKGFISQVERDLTSPSIATLIDILEALGTNINEFFTDTIDEKIVFHQEDVFVKEETELGMEIEWIVPNAQKNMMEPIQVTLHANGQSYEDEAHEGEEFGYMLEGKATLHLGKKKYQIKNGESFYFKANKAHKIVNETNEPCKFLWVSNPPSF